MLPVKMETERTNPVRVLQESDAAHWLALLDHTIFGD
jgi:hypothetical protein